MTSTNEPYARTDSTQKPTPGAFGKPKGSGDDCKNRSVIGMTLQGPVWGQGGQIDTPLRHNVSFTGAFRK